MGCGTCKLLLSILRAVHSCRPEATSGTTHRCADALLHIASICGAWCARQAALSAAVARVPSCSPAPRVLRYCAAHW